MGQDINSGKRIIKWQKENLNRMEAGKAHVLIKGAEDAQHREPKGRAETQRNEVRGYSC